MAKNTLVDRPPSPPTVLFLVKNFRQGNGGAPEAVRIMATKLLASGIDSNVCDNGRVLKDVGTFSNLPEDSLRLSSQFEVGQLSYDAVIIVGPWQNPFSTLKVLSHFAKAAPIFYCPKGGLSAIEFLSAKGFFKHVYFRLFEEMIIAKARAIVFTAEIERDQSRARLSRFKSVVIPDFIEQIASSSQLGISEPFSPAQPSSIRFAFLAEISPRKGLDKLLKAFKSRKFFEQSNAASWGLKVAGAPRPSSAKYFDRVLNSQEYRNLRNIGALKYIGALPHESRSDFYKSCDVFVIPSLYESFSLTYWEALSMGCIVVASSQIGAIEFEKECKVFVADPNSADDFACALNRACACYHEGFDREKQILAAQRSINAVNTNALEKWLSILQF